MNIFKLTTVVLLVCTATTISAQNSKNSEKKAEVTNAKEIIARPVVNPAVLKPIPNSKVKAENVTPQKVNATSRKVEAVEPKKK